MRKTILFFTILFFAFAVHAQTAISVVPKPVSVEQRDGKPFMLDANTKVVVNVGNPELDVAEYLHEYLRKAFGDIKPIVDKKTNAKYNMANSIIFVGVSDKILGKEGYQLNVLPDRIIIQANENAGFFYAVQTLFQLTESDFLSADRNKEIKSYSVPQCKIVDYPRFAYRGKHLDVARHFFTVEQVKRYIDLLAFHKLNVFHFHLTDDQGWRIEIKRYPRLQTVASKRRATIIGHYTDNDARNPNYDNVEHSGYYTQEQIRDIVNYAAKRQITVIPEIEMPGHALAALAAYPSLGCKDTNYEVACTWGVFDQVFCTKDETIEFLKNVLDEVAYLFPSPYIHIGGDECPKTRWQHCPECQKQIREHGLKDEYELQSYFMQQMEEHLEKKHKKVIAWDEILEGGIKGDVTVMSWQGEKGGIDAARSGHNAIMAPAAYLYFDYYQAEADNEPLAIGGYTPLKKVYHYEPVPKELLPEERKYIIGVQANTWTEYLPDFDKVLYMDYPRTAALSETAWTQKEDKDYKDFLNRLEHLLKCYDAMQVNYSRSHYAISADVFYNSDTRQVELKLNTPAENSRVVYTLDGSEPDGNSKVFSDKIIIDSTTLVSACAIRDGKIVSPVFRSIYNLNKATGRKYVLEHPNPQYSGSTANALTDGMKGSQKSFDKWVGTLGHDYNLVLDLERQEEFSHISISFLDGVGSWIFLPTEVSFYYSDDGLEWNLISPQNCTIDRQGQIQTYNVNTEPLRARYIKVYARTVRQCPEGHPGYGYDAHCFADEIIVR